MTRWLLDRVDGEIRIGTSGETLSHSFLGSVKPCNYVDNVRRVATLDGQCRGSGIVLPLSSAGDVYHVTVSVVFSSMEQRRAAGPEFPADGDNDGDGVPNGSDICPTRPNPAVDGEQSPDPCALKDSTGAVIVPRIRDSDQDRVADLSDNCIWQPNPPAEGTRLQADRDDDLIGDACEVIAPVSIPGDGGEIRCEHEIRPQPGRVTLLFVDFGEAVSCSAGFESCTLDPSRVVIEDAAGELAPPVCTFVPTR